MCGENSLTRHGWGQIPGMFRLRAAIVARGTALNVTRLKVRGGDRRNSSLEFKLTHNSYFGSVLSLGQNLYFFLLDKANKRKYNN